MGNYTELRLVISLRDDTPIDVVRLLSKVAGEGDIGLPVGTVLFDHESVPRPTMRHPFFGCERWYMLLMATDFGSTTGSWFGLNTKDHWVLMIHSSYKNYDNELDQFLNWITPYVHGRKKKQYAGWYQNDSMDQRENIYILR